jgi:hypothetical protein
MRKLLLSTSVIALALGMGMASASANGPSWGGSNSQPVPNSPTVTYPSYDKVATEVLESHKFSNKVDNDWSWTKDVTETVDIDIEIDSYIPKIEELTQISNVQKLFGSVYATTNINTTVSGGTTTETKTEYDHWGYPKVKTVTTTTPLTSVPVVLGSATAVGNMFSLSSSDPTLLLNSDQIHMPNDGYPVAVNATLNSTVTGAAVKLDSTAVGNMLSINMSEPDVVVASIMQTSYADVSATANSNQTLSGSFDYAEFNGLSPENITGGVLVNPPTMNGVIASVSATAVGNMASINLGTYASIPQGAGTSFDTGN